MLLAYANQSFYRPICLFEKILAPANRRMYFSRPVDGQRNSGRSGERQLLNSRLVIPITMCQTLPAKAKQKKPKKRGLLYRVAGGLRPPVKNQGDRA